MAGCAGASCPLLRDACCPRRSPLILLCRGSRSAGAVRPPPHRRGLPKGSRALGTASGRRQARHLCAGRPFSGLGIPLCAPTLSARGVGMRPLSASPRPFAGSVAGRVARLPPSLRSAADARRSLFGGCSALRAPFFACGASSLPLARCYRFAYCATPLRSPTGFASLEMRSGFARPTALPPFRSQHATRFASPASVVLSHSVRARFFHWLAPALPAYVGLGSPARTADAVGSSLPTTARPTSHVTLPATDDGRGHVRSAHHRDSLRCPLRPEGHC